MFLVSEVTLYTPVNFRKKTNLLEHGFERAALEAVSVLEARRDDRVAPALGRHEHGLCLVRLRADLRAKITNVFRRW